MDSISSRLPLTLEKWKATAEQSSDVTQAHRQGVKDSCRVSLTLISMNDGSPFGISLNLTPFPCTAHAGLRERRAADARYQQVDQRASSCRGKHIR